ncbi:cold shock CspA family protein [Actinoplanes octamycinicus]|uniref:Cold shock CspA family protein n=1 Tax=Actinoplanes octamycinicus TaxID=135948 RepID=A0A7W7GY04_9ACTN|nr:cold shock domain-containing protein [Actinoplanes octamycinicus]MBB4740384.1 cold shock CspA family protein [Actinoplanes octamycinicus]GIE59645.1 DNA-binding protein [Actinoplanes octamycinicus]
MASVGKVIRYDEVRGYGFIAPAEGGEDVFVHANDFGDQRGLVHSGMRVEYEVEVGDRGLKVASLRVLEPATPARSERDAATVRAGVPGDDEGMCDVLSGRELMVEVTEALIGKVPALTGAQIAAIRQTVVDLARSHGWVES